MTRRVPFDPGLGRFSLAGANQVHNAPAGGCNHTLDTRKGLRLLLKKLSHGHFKGFRYSAKGLGARLEVAIFNARKVRSGDAGAFAKLPLADAFLVPNLHDARSNTHKLTAPILFGSQS
jgi:hypothetical protein